MKLQIVILHPKISFVVLYTYLEFNEFLDQDAVNLKIFLKMFGHQKQKQVVLLHASGYVEVIIYKLWDTLYFCEKIIMLDEANPIDYI